MRHPLHLLLLPWTLALLLLPTPSTASSSSSKITLIDSTGTLNRSSPPLPTPPNGILTILTNPGTHNHLFPTTSISNTLTAEQTPDDILLLTSPGSSLITSTTSSNPIENGNGGATAAALSGSVIVTGITEIDCEDLPDTRHGRTLAALFCARLLNHEDDRQKTLLILAVDGSLENVNEEELKRDVGDLFDAAFLGLGEDVEEKGIGSMEDIYDVEVLGVESEEDVRKIIAMAEAAASRSPLTPNSTPLLPSLTSLFSKLTTTTSSQTTTTTPLISFSILTCQDAFHRLSKSSRAKLTTWQNRASRGLVVDKFKSQATALLKRTMEQYDKDTIQASGTTAAAYRLELRTKLKESIEKTLRELFEIQVENCEASTLKNFQTVLLKQTNKELAQDATRGYDKNAAAVRAAAFTFDTTLTDLELPFLGLYKTKYTQQILEKLNAALSNFPDTPAAQLRDMKIVRQKASKQKKPTERSMDIGLGLVAMIRPDGFGNLQGYTGYTKGSYSMTVGFHNDADAPETISQFGGTRPPFLRVQPKLNLDVEL